MSEDEAPSVAGFWDYGTEMPDGAMAVVTVDSEGAGRIECATVAGDQLRHLGCPPAGPCVSGEVG